MQDGGINMDTLLETTTDGTPYVFRSEVLSYSEEEGTIRRVAKQIGLWDLLL